MAERIIFEVKEYDIEVGRESSIYSGGREVKLDAHIVGHGKLSGKEYYVIIYCVQDGSPMPDNIVREEGRNGLIYVPRWKYEWFVDLLRNESPVFCHLFPPRPNLNCLSTSREPVGEGEK
jgi:hypothetical protein